MVYECGDLLGEGERFPDGPRHTVVDVDLDRIRQERLRIRDAMTTTVEARRAGRSGRSAFELGAPTGDIGLRRKLDRFPFVPDDADRLAQDCYEAYSIQVAGLSQRMRAIGEPEGRRSASAAASTRPTP